jgi:predicted transcriptional regulator
MKYNTNGKTFAIRTNIPEKQYLWLKRNSTKRKIFMNELISETIEFYEQNKHLPLQIKAAKLILSELIDNNILSHIKNPEKCEYKPSLEEEKIWNKIAHAGCLEL